MWIHCNNTVSHTETSPVTSISGKAVGDIHAYRIQADWTTLREEGKKLARNSLAHKRAPLSATF